MKPEIRDLIKKAKVLGYVNEGQDGRQHYKLRHEVTGEVVRLPGTSSDWRGLRNCERELIRRATPEAQAGRRGSRSNYAPRPAARAQSV